MKFIQIIFIVGFFLLLNPIWAQLSDEVKSKERIDITRWQTVKEDFKDAYKGIGHVYSRPFHWKKKQWLTFGSVVGGTALITFIDEPAYKYFKGHKSNFADELQVIGDEYGDPKINLFVGSIYLIGATSNVSWLREPGTTAIVSLASIGLIEVILKRSVGRSRPDSDNGNWTYKPFDSDVAFHSFPSGHTNRAMIVSFAFAKHTKSPLLKAAFYTMGGITAWSRVYSGSHWASDVALSTAMSYLTVETVYAFLQKRKELRKTKYGTKMSFHIEPRSNGLAVVWSW